MGQAGQVAGSDQGIRLSLHGFGEKLPGGTTTSVHFCLLKLALGQSGNTLCEAGVLGVGPGLLFGL